MNITCVYIIETNKPEQDFELILRHSSNNGQNVYTINIKIYNVYKIIVGTYLYRQFKVLFFPRHINVNNVCVRLILYSNSYGIDCGVNQE